MRFTKIDKMPNFRKGYSERQRELIEFMNMGVKCVKVTLAPGEYSNVSVARVTLYTSAKRAGLPIKPKIQQGELYLIRTDM